MQHLHCCSRSWHCASEMDFKISRLMSAMIVPDSRWNHTALVQEAAATKPPLPPAPPHGPASSGIALSSISSKRSEGSTVRGSVTQVTWKTQSSVLFHLSQRNRSPRLKCMSSPPKRAFSGKSFSVNLSAVKRKSTMRSVVEGCQCSNVYVPAAVAFAAFAELHSREGTEATAARAQQETASSRPMVSHQVGSAIPAVTMHARTYIIVNC